MFTLWTKKLNKNQHSEFRAQVVAAMPVLKRFKEVIQDEITYSENNSFDKENYNLTAWPYFQADNIGQQRAYRKVIKLLENLTGEDK